MSQFESALRERLDSLEEQKLLRRLRRLQSPQQVAVQLDGKSLLNFSSNDYLGLATHPLLKAASIKATERWGTGSGASRLVSGSLEPHHELEEMISGFKGTEAALTFSSGYATALGTITALVDKNDILILDKLVHASIVDAGRLSGATLRVFRHNDLNDLESTLTWAVENRKGQVLVVTESLFSMDGDVAPLPAIVELKDKAGAWLMVDEAHATGVFGPNRRGLAEQFNVSQRIEVQMGTLGKALGSAGGYIAGSRTLIDYLINKARSFIFSTAPPPAASAAASAAIQIVQSPTGAELSRKLESNIDSLRTVLGLCSAAMNTPILPLIVGAEEKALHLADHFREQGIFVPAIRYPSVGRGKARLRFTASAAHEPDDLNSVGRLIQIQRQQGLL